MPRPKDPKERLALARKVNFVPKQGGGHGNAYPIEKRAQVVKTWLLLGSIKLTAAHCNVQYDLIRKWKQQPWWPEMVAELRATENIEMDNKLSDIVQKSLDAAYDRIVNGDFIYDQKSGEIRRKPASLRDIHRVASDLLTQRETLRDKADASGDHKQTSVDEHLKLLASRMAEWFEDKKKPVVIDMEEVEDAVYEERETGLQAGERSVQFPSGEREEARGEEQGEGDSDENGSGA